MIEETLHSEIKIETIKHNKKSEFGPNSPPKNLVMMWSCLPSEKV